VTRVTYIHSNYSTEIEEIKLTLNYSYTGVFNPWDRALYLSVSNHRPFLHRLNFDSPMKGVFQTIFQRGISSGLYFPLEEIFTIHLKHTFKSAESETWSLLIAGLMAGAGNGIIMNPMSSIKYHYWSHTGGVMTDGGVMTGDKKFSFTSVAHDMFKRGGLRPFFVGVNATISRDVIFGGIFAYLRHELPKMPFFSTYCAPASTSSPYTHSTSSSQFQRAMNDSALQASPIPSSMLTSAGSERKSSQHNTTGDHSTNKIESRHTFLTDLLAGFVATTLSAPLNYVRNIHYSLPPDIKPDSTYTVLSDLWLKACQEKTFIEKASYLQSRLRLGWGTARVGCGMAFAAQCYSFIKTLL
jgi:Mitochondrial carrier protein